VPTSPFAVLELSGSLTQNATINVPNNPGQQWTLYNGVTANGHTITFQVTGGSGFTLASGKRCVAYCNGSLALEQVTAAN
jgi:hypothetical protein